MPRRIAVVIDPWDYPYNGTVVSTRRFVAALEAQGYEFQLLTLASERTGPDGGFERLSIPGVNGIIDAMRAPLARPDRTKLRRLLADCDLLHVQYPFFLAYSAIGEARKLNIPVVCSFHVQPENILQNVRLPSATLSRWLYRAFIRWFYDRADHVIAPSAFAAGLLQRHGLQTPVSVLSNGVPARFFGVEPRPGGRPYRILSVGRLAREKQQETLIQAVAGSRFAAETELVLAGVGPREAYLKKLAGMLGVRARIGWIEDQALLQLYGDAHLFVHTGTIELEGMSVLEAMAAGNAVVVSDAEDSACAAILHEQRSRFRHGDAADLTSRIDFWLAHDEERLAHGRLNRLFARTLSHDKAVQKLMAFYDEILGEAPRAEANRMAEIS